MSRDQKCKNVHHVRDFGPLRSLTPQKMLCCVEMDATTDVRFPIRTVLLVLYPRTTDATSLVYFKQNS